MSQRVYRRLYTINHTIQSLMAYRSLGIDNVLCNILTGGNFHREAESTWEDSGRLGSADIGQYSIKVGILQDAHSFSLARKQSGGQKLGIRSSDSAHCSDYGIYIDNLLGLRLCSTAQNRPHRSLYPATSHKIVPNISASAARQAL